MTAMASVDGEIVPLDHARVPITDRGFLWGDHVFEIMRAVGVRVADLDAHLARLTASAERIGMAAPDHTRITRTVTSVLTRGGARDAAVRVVWTRGDAHRLSPSSAGEPRLVVVAEPLEDTGATAPTPGVRLAVIHSPRSLGLVPHDAKTGNYLPSVLALAAAEAAGADDALLVDGDDLVLETATANVFAVSSTGTVITPVGALLPGVTAARVAKLLAQLGVTVRHAPLPLPVVRAAAELFVTSARRGPVPVAYLDGEARASGPITHEIQVAYKRWLGEVARGD